ncbi:putative oxidoreductase [Defluviimonas aquaemixtae]|uniref:Putative oxidoreductase n=1 Tax=Albidovulum aquaemixtae TaxID=1542388 RepID=A0A2R8B3R8_9RHOB|nr:aldo/keto reductase [Defluviimonas aquaemixtae]SPH17170.1 putative oxidoreductase [Defluviimonas aquaemixtae]
MRQVTLGGDGPAVSVFCLGTMTWGTQTPEAEAHAQIDAAAARGVNFMDTAEMYPVNPVRKETVGRTEEIIGNWIAKGGRRADWVIATKIAGEGSVARDPGEVIDGRSIRKALERSLKRLRTDHVDLYQFHWPNRGSYMFRKHWRYDPSTQDREAVIANMIDCLETLAALKAEGKIRHWGLSNESAWGMAQWLRLADAGHGPRPLSVQNEYSLLCRLYDTDLAELGHNEKVTLLAFSPLAAGLLTGKYAGDVVPAGSRREHNPELGGRITARVWETVSAYLGIAGEAGLDPAQMALAWTLTRPFPVVPIFGATTLAQLEHALGAADLSLSGDVLDAIAVAHKAHPMPY